MNILIIGATSAIAQATARQFTQEKPAFFLVARAKDKLAIVADDLRARGASRCETYCLDVDQLEDYAAMVKAAYDACGIFDIILIAHGVLTPQAQASESPSVTAGCMLTNATSIMALTAHLLPHLKQARRGCLAVISSVAGDRGRAALYTYGAAKAALNVFLQGVRGELLPFGVRVLTIKPGYVDTPMTKQIKKNILFAPVERVGKRISDVIRSGKGGEIYVPRFWWLMMTILRLIPESIFLRLPI
jgi:short-subunit dehydrogenase